MTRIDILKIAGGTMLVAAAVFIQDKLTRPRPQIEARAGAVSEVSSQFISSIGTATKLAGGYVAGPTAPQETFELTKNDTPLELITTLINAPFDQEPGEIVNTKNNWQALAFPPDYCDSPSYSKTYRRKGPGLEISLYAYTVPSLTEAKELIMSGELKIFRDIDQAVVLDLLKTNGFEAKSTEKHLSSPGSRGWTDVMEIEKGTLSGLMYFEPHGSGRALKIRLEHKDSGLYSYRGPAVERYTKFAQFAGKLTADLEQQGTARIIGAAWPEIKNMIAVTSVSIPIETLIDARSAILTSSPEGDRGAPFMVLETLIVDHLFRMVNSRLYDTDTPTKELKLLDGSGIQYELKERYNIYYAPKENSLFKTYKEYPDTYWGQYTFMNEMESGFAGLDTSAYLPGVIKKGEEFLSKHGDSPFLPRVLFLLGKANETAYSVGLYPDRYNFACTDFYCKELERNNEKYRLGAIKYFTDLLARPGGKEYEEHLRYILPKLRTKGSAYCVFFINLNPC